MTKARDIERQELFTNWLTSVEDHHVSQQGAVPDIDPEGWDVSLTGDVEETELAVDELQSAYPSVTVAHTMECAGNGRAFFESDTGAPPWGVGGVSTAFWSGVPLSAVLERHDAATGEDIWVTAVGADRPNGDTAFARSIPMSKALDDCILAYAINGEPLPLEHGQPLRLVVPGWYGVNSVKWLTELRVMDRMVCGRAWDDDLDRTYWHQERYRLTPKGETPTHREQVETGDTWAQLQGDDVDHPYTFDQHVKSVIGDPSDGDTVEPREDGTVEILGMAWAGDAELETVEVSTDGGETWTEASFLSPAYPGAWRLFRYLWEPDAGTYRLASRATDERGHSQPLRLSAPIESWDEAADDEYPWNEDGYGGNATLPHAVEVTVGEETRATGGDTRS